eukprot:COSAG02_NODE_1844_length_10683_cov_622.961357_5_plen_74_part_00
MTNSRGSIVLVAIVHLAPLRFPAQVDKDGWSALMYAAHANHVVGRHIAQPEDKNQKQRKHPPTMPFALSQHRC